jgi:hypothetical protein
MLAEAGFEQAEAGTNPLDRPRPIDPLDLVIPPAKGLRLGPLRLIPFLRRLDHRTQTTNHHLTQLADAVRELIEQLYPPVEAYASARKPE